MLKISVKIECQNELFIAHISRPIFC